MICPFCGSSQNKVVDKRGVNGSGEIRRRRECLKCSKRFTTYEKVANLELMVVKRDGHQELFCRDKIKNGLIKALRKRPGSEQVDELVSKIERKLRKKGAKQVTSKLIGQMVLAELKKLDIVAYLRFVSVYREFKDSRDFAKEIQSLN
ncbi:transcriptional regulator NrdR [Patescibacteria group bacterium]|nr:transcriptional regulator NrdR [Patescibacteria group bacterium]MCL5409889.1 transcriptional regulator NrdR [Patescibacteria group bacterium]